MFRSVFFLILTFLYIFNPVLGAAGDSAFGNSLKDSFKGAVAELHIPGAVMIIQSPDGQRQTITAGVRKLGSSAPVNEKLRFRIGSITKTFVASVILMLVEDGVLDLDSRVHKILPEVIDSDNPVTVRHLLQMRSNMGNFSSDKKFLSEFRQKPWKKWSPSHLLNFGSRSRKPAGILFEYNNSNYVLLGMIIERLTKDTFENQVHNRILRPLKLKSTSFPTTTASIGDPYARGYDYDPATDVVRDLSLKINPSWAWCSGNAISTASDIMNWITAYLAGYGIGRKLHKEQMEFQPALHKGVSYGLGVMNKFGAVGHNGNFAGIFTASAFSYRGYYFVILTNGQAYGADNNATAESVFWKIVRDFKGFKR